MAVKAPRNDCVSAQIKSLGSKLERGFQIAEKLVSMSIYQAVWLC